MSLSMSLRERKKSQFFKVQTYTVVAQLPEVSVRRGHHSPVAALDVVVITAYFARLVLVGEF